ncbi:MAG TPA: VWA domain-containing protein [Verrucomicrobiae bacterium]|nr:VWA domain-containing protein [Verrucomicrobiae bacterium]
MNQFAHPHFAEPQWLWLAAFGPVVLAALQWHAASARRRQLARMASPRFQGDLVRSHSPARRWIKNAMLVAAVAGIGLALARPQWGEREQASQAVGEDIVFLLDCSRSMLAADVRPDRLQRSKLAILDFMRRRPHSRLGLVAFSGEAFLQCPLTFDYSSFEESLMAVDDKTIPVPGTDIGAALDEGFRALDKSEEHKLMVLVTDGEDLEKGGVKMADKLAGKGVVVFTIGVGTPAGTEIKMPNDQGQMQFVRDSQGEIVRSRLDEPTLRAIAHVTHGEYFPLGNLGEGLARVRAALESHSKFGFAPARTLGVERFHIPVAAVLGLLMIEAVMSTRKRRPIGPRSV